jgi:hypothetical protein
LADSWARAKAEVEVREILTGNETGQEEEGEEGGSDSEPSVADVPQSWLRRSKAWKSMTSRLAGRRGSSLSGTQEGEKTKSRKAGRRKGAIQGGQKRNGKGGSEGQSLASVPTAMLGM